jgi:antitoxin (DNA-binding transcriptional repressor) of toxin-antitoxin stability system
LAVLKHVEATRAPVVVSNRGKAVAKMVPMETDNSDIFGFMAGRMTIIGDIESPVVALKDWKIFKK